MDSVTSVTMSSMSDIEIRNLINELEKINKSNLEKIKNFNRFAKILDKIEISIKIEAKKYIRELDDIMHSIDEDIEIFKNICKNTKITEN